MCSFNIKSGKSYCGTQRYSSKETTYTEIKEQKHEAQNRLEMHLWDILKYGKRTLFVLGHSGVLLVNVRCENKD